MNSSKKSGSTGSPEQKNKLVLAMIALREPALPEIAVLTDRLKQYPVAAGFTNFERKDNIIFFSESGETGTIALMSAPIPWTDLEGPCATSWLWPEAAAELQQHTHHLIVALFGDAADVISSTLKATALVAALCPQDECVGVYWGGGRLVLSKKVFVAFAEKMTRDFLPIYLWIDFRRQQEADGTFTVYTTGMEALGFMEIEIRNSKLKPSDLIGHAFNVCHYLLDHGPIVKDGDTIGLTAEEKIRVRHVPSMWDYNQTVYQLAL